MSDEYEDDPAISAIYRKAGDIAPPPSLDDGILAAAKHVAWRRKQRWILPLSTAAVVVLSVALLMNMSDEWDFSSDRATSSPVPPTSSSSSEPTMVQKKKSALPAAQPELAVEDKSRSVVPAGVSAAKPGPAPSAATMTSEAAPASGSISTDRVRSKSATAPSEELTRQAAREKAESSGILSFSDDFSTELNNTQDKQTASMRADTATPDSEPEAEVQKQTGVQAKFRKEPIEQKTLEPKPWLAKIRKLLSAGEKEAARKELEAFKKHYPNYKLPDDLRSLWQHE